MDFLKFKKKIAGGFWTVVTRNDMWMFPTSIFLKRIAFVPWLSVLFQISKGFCNKSNHTKDHQGETPEIRNEDKEFENKKN